MSAARDRRAQTASLVRLRQARLEAAANALAAARRATAEADAAAGRADETAAQRDLDQIDARDELAADPAEAERRLAVLDRALFEQALARQNADRAAEALSVCVGEENTRRRAMVLARARHDVLADHLGTLDRRSLWASEERLARELEDDRSRP